MSEETERRDDPLNESEGAAEEDVTPQDAPAEPDASPSGSLPRTTTTGDDEQDYRQPGDGAVSAAPDDDLEESR